MVAGLHSYFGSKLDSPEWMYRWLSGIAHGHIWVNTTAKQTNAEGISTQTVTVDWNRFGLSLIYCFDLFNNVLKIYENPKKFIK